ncbi:hypothetical protein PG990_011954 [Apiospora arundinis]
MGPVHRLLPLVFGAIAAQKYGATSSSFLVSNFIAGATPHSADGYADLNLWYAEDSVSANCHASPLTYQIFPSVPWTVCSDYRTAYNLTVTGDGGAELRLSYLPTGARPSSTARTRSRLIRSSGLIRMTPLGRYKFTWVRGASP